MAEYPSVTPGKDVTGQVLSDHPDLMRAAMVAAGIDDSHIRTVPDRSFGLDLISPDRREPGFSNGRDQSAARLLAWFWTKGHLRPSTRQISS